MLAVAFENTEMVGRLHSVTATVLSPVAGVPTVAPADPAYGLRDPSFAVLHGWYYLVATRPRRAAYLGTGATTLQVYRSSNLVDWVPLPDLPAGVTGATRAWAPELLIDGDTATAYYAVTTDTTEDAGAITSFEVYARQSADMLTWGPAVRMAGLTGPSTPKVIDPCVVRIGDPRGTYVMFYKDETAATINRAWANSPLGPWTPDRTGNWLGISSAVEGPELVRLPDGRWRLYYDRYTASRLAYRESDDLDTWSAETPLTYSPAGLRHPGYLPVSDEQLVALLARPRHVRAYTAAAQPVPSGTPTVLPMGVAQGDTELWSSAQPTRLVAAGSGWYSIHPILRWPANTDGKRSLAYRFSTGPMQWLDSRPATGGGFGTEHNGSDVDFWLNAGEYVEVYALQSSGAALTVSAVVSFSKAGG
jgi:hypothetical protein